MDLNATLLGQMITFAILVWFTMKYVWPPIVRTLDEREKKIVAGLEAAERSKRDLEMAGHKVLTMLREAKQEAQQIIDQAHLNAAKVIEEAKEQSKGEGARLIEQAQQDIQREMMHAKEALRTQLAGLVMHGAEKVMESSLDKKAHERLLSALATEI